MWLDLSPRATLQQVITITASEEGPNQIKSKLLVSDRRRQNFQAHFHGQP